ncbi:MAG: hypothetical protein AAF434_18030 [Pseudomonadota bacterium]
MSNAPSPVDQFMYWQCRIRQDSVRTGGGRPTAGMQPAVFLNSGGEAIGRINTLIVKSDSTGYITHFRHIVKKTQDPSARLKSALQVLSEAYYQQSKGFSTELLALFSVDSNLANTIVNAGECVLDFQQDAHHHRLRCQARELEENEDGHQAIYWHNHMFNPRMPGRVRVLGFQPKNSPASE